MIDWEGLPYNVQEWITDVFSQKMIRDYDGFDYTLTLKVRHAGELYNAIRDILQYANVE